MAFSVLWRKGKGKEMTCNNRFQRFVKPHAFVIALAMVLVLGFAHVVAAAEELPREAALPLALANKAAAAAQEKCKQTDRAPMK